MDALYLLYLGALALPHDAHGRRCRSVSWLVAQHSASHGGRSLPLESVPCQLIRWASAALRWRLDQTAAGGQLPLRVLFIQYG